jgi:hypothetical protein
MKKLNYIALLAIILLISCAQRDTKLVKSIINPPTNYKPITKIDGKIRDVTFINTKRLVYDFDINNEVSDEVIEKEIRYWLYKIWIDNKDTKAISVRCFKKEFSFYYMDGVFAPYGEWEKANVNVGLSKFKVKIH